MNTLSFVRSTSGRPVIALALGVAVACLYAYPVANAEQNSLVISGVSAFAAEDDMISVNVGSANILIQRDAESGGTLRLVGSGWVNEEGKGSTITIKLNHLVGGEVVQYQRGGADTGVFNDSDIIAHPKSGKKDSTIFWQFDAKDDGTFDVQEALPLHLEKGQMLKLNVASGLVEGDVSRSTVSPSLRVEGEQWVEPENTKPECHPTTTPPSAVVAHKPDSKNRLHVEGYGFCNKNGGGSKVAIKIDEAIVQHVEAYKIHENSTIWQIVSADDHTGDFSVDVQLPDGTLDGPYGTVRPFEDGEHTLRVLSGSLQEGDTRVSLPPRGQRFPFIVGTYKPSRVPNPLSYQDDLIKSAQGGITASKDNGDVVVTVPGGKEGDWVYVNAYIDDGSPRLPWSDSWFQLDSQGKARLPHNEDIPSGPLKITVQDGNEGQYGNLLGWDWLVYEMKSADDDDSDSTTDDTGKKKKEKLSDVASMGAELNSLAAQIGRLDKAATAGMSQHGKKSQDSGDSAARGQSDGASGGTRVRRVVKRVVRSGGSTHTTSGRSTSRRSSGAASSIEKKPQHRAKPPVRDVKGFNSGNAHGAEASFKGDVVRIKLPELKTGQWANLYVYPVGSGDDPVNAGWVQVDSKGRVRLDTSGLPDGDYTIAATDAKDKMAGWVEVSLGDGTADQSQDEQGIVGSGVDDSTQDPSNLRYAGAGMMSPVDWWLIGISILIPLLSGGVLALFRRKF